MKKAMLTVTMMLSLSSATGANVEILTPEEHVATGFNHLHVVGRTEASSVLIAVNEIPQHNVSVKESIFHARVWFGYGLNEIVATAMDSTGVATSDTVEILCSPKISREVEYLFEPYTFHSSDQRQQCLGCHTAPSSDTSLDADPGAVAWCASCHDEVSSLFMEHAKGNDIGCVQCHQMDTELSMMASGTYLDANPCFSCHADKIGQFAKEFIHGPVAGGTCTVCHDPHGSQYAKNLLMPVPVLCPSCHVGVEKASATAKYLHRPFEDGDCVSCHDPHSTNNKWVLLRKSNELCLGCHEELRNKGIHRHPYGVKPKSDLGKTLALTEGGELECLSCHDPHGSQGRHLLASTHETACLGCHGDKQ